MDSVGSVATAALASLLAVVLSRLIPFLWEAWGHRALLMRLRRDGKPMPKHHAILGHLLEAKTASDALPPKAHSNYILDLLSKQLGRPAAYYFDSFPITVPMLIVGDPYLASQATNHPWSGSEKPETFRDWFEPISGKGGMNLFTENGKEWKENHDLFLPFFNNSNLDATMPVVVTEMLIFREALRDKAKSRELFHLEPLTLRLMNDIIGRIVFNAELGNQTAGSHPLSDTMLRQLRITFSSQNVEDNLGQLNPLRKLRIWNNGRRLDTQIRAQIQKRLEAFRRTKPEDEQESFKSILDQALEDYYSKRGRTRKMDIHGEFMSLLCAQLRMFFFAGYDSTSCSMIALCYLVWTHPDVLAKLRKEHDEIFGRNVEACPATIAENPTILNSLPYTNAVIKESMRLFPPANGIRTGCKDLVLKDRDGNEFPTEGVVVQMNHLTIQRNAALWPRPLEFLPERFLVGPEHELYPTKGGWRPFEFGVRSCTGQALVVKELKAFLAILAREFDVEECYDEVYAHEKGKVDLTNVNHEKAYLIEAGAGHPRGQFPCRISLSGYASRTE